MAERRGGCASVAAGAGDHEVLVDGVRGDAQTLLHVGPLGLRLKRAAYRIHHGEDAGRHREHDAGRHHELDQAEALGVERAKPPHGAFLTATSRAARTFCSVVTITCSTSAPPAWTAIGSIDHRRM